MAMLVENLSQKCLINIHERIQIHYHISRGVQHSGGDQVSTSFIHSWVGFNQRDTTSQQVCSHLQQAATWRKTTAGSMRKDSSKVCQLKSTPRFSNRTSTPVGRGHTPAGLERYKSHTRVLPKKQIKRLKTAPPALY